MDIYVEGRWKSSLTSREVKTLSRLCFGPKHGNMWFVLNDNPSDCLLWIARTVKGRIVGWCIAEHLPHVDVMCIYGWRRESRMYDLDVFVHPSYRERGIARMLLEEATEILKKRMRRRIEMPFNLRKKEDNGRRKSAQ